MNHSLPLCAATLGTNVYRLVSREKEREITGKKKRWRKREMKETRGRFKVLPNDGGSVDQLSNNLSWRGRLECYISFECRLSLCARTLVGDETQRRVYGMCVACACDTNINYETSRNPRTRMDVAYSPICLVASGEKTKWLSGAGFSPYAHALSSRRSNHVPNVEQRRHTNPHGYPGRRAGEWFFPSLFLSVSPPFPARLLLSALHSVD